MDTWVNHPAAVSAHALSYLEVYPIVCSAVVWGKYWTNKMIVFLCDNEGTVLILRKGRTSCKFINTLMRRLVVLATLHNFVFLSQWLSTKMNVEADLLSQGHICLFQALMPDTVKRIQCPSQN